LGSYKENTSNTPGRGLFGNRHVLVFEVNVYSRVMETMSTTTQFRGRVEVQPDVFMVSDSTSNFHAPTMTEADYQAWCADDVSFADDYADWVSGADNPIRKIARTPDEAFARAVLRSYLPGFAEAEEALDPYRENPSNTPRRNTLHTYTTQDKRAAVLMAERLGVRKASRKLGIPLSTLHGWIKNGIDPKPEPAMPGRKRGNRPERLCPCGVLTRYHVNYRPTCQDCYVKSEEYQRDKRQWQSDVLALKIAVSS